MKQEDQVQTKLILLEMLPVQLKVLDQAFIDEFGLPAYATPGSAAVDLRANIDPNYIDLNGTARGQITIMPGETRLIGSGIAINIDDHNTVAKLYPRSGLGNRGLVLGNLTGIIDSDYQGEVKVSLWNRSGEPIVISRGDRVAQMALEHVVRASFDVVPEFTTSTERGENGFGHTGTA